jgi:DNA-binding MarR family transcriptional regulator
MSETGDFNPMGCNCLALRQAARQVTQLYERHMAPLGLRVTQYSVLSRLARRGPLPINRLAAAMAMDRTTASRAIGPLRRDRLIATATGADGRQRVIALTKAGEARLKAARAGWRAAQAEFEKRYGAGDAARLRAELARAAAAG